MSMMNQVWDDTVAFIKRERALVIPVVLATLLVGDVVASLAMVGDPQAERSPLQLALFIAGALISMFGQLSVATMVLRPGQTVGEAMQHARSRMGKVLLVAIVLVFAAIIAMLPVGMAAVAAGVDPEKAQTMEQLPGWISVMMLVIVGLLLWVGVRIALINALIIDRNPKLTTCFKAGFAMTQGIAAQLAIVMAIYLVTVLVLTSAVRFVLGTLFTLLGAAVGSPFLGVVLTTLGTGIVGAALSAIAAIYLAILYRHRAGSNISEAFR